MSPTIGAAMYFIFWWLCFFMTLPIGVRNLDEAGVKDVAGLERGAPEAPNLAKKALWAAGGAAVLWVIAWGVLQYAYYSR